MLGALLILAQSALGPAPVERGPKPPISVQASAHAVILEAARIDFSRIPEPRRPQKDGLRIVNFE
jgi:hypothetical protein